MSADALRQILHRAVDDAVFRAGLFKQPEQILAGYLLTAEELAMLHKLKPEDLYALVGGYAVSQLLPIRVGKRLVIAPQWLNVTVAPGKSLIRLDQGKTGAGIDREGRPVRWDGSVVTPDAPLAFGSGLHPTTCLCLEAFENLLNKGETVLDLGTGSGILAIAAAKLGARRVLALDTDAGAVQVAREHVVLNQVEQVVQVELGSVQTLRASNGIGTDFTAQLIVANLTAAGIQSVLQDGLVEVLQPPGCPTGIKPAWTVPVQSKAGLRSGGVKPPGWMIFSGFLSRELAGIEKAVEAAGMVITDRKQREDWCMIISQRLL